MRTPINVLLLASLLALLCLPAHPAAAQGSATDAVDSSGILSPGCHMLSLEYEGEGLQPMAVPSRSWSCTLGHYSAGEVVTMTARPGPGATVSGWDGTDNDSSVADASILTMPADDHRVLVTYVSPQVAARVWLPLLAR